MSNRIGYALAVMILLVSAGLRLWDLAQLPPGLSSAEIDEIVVAESARQGSVRIFYNFRGEGLEGFYPALLASVTTMTGGGLIGYRILSVAVGLIALALTYALGQRLFGTSAGLAAMALFGFSLFPVLLARGITRETLLPLYIAGTLLALARALPIYGVQEEKPARSTSFAALAVLLGLGFYLHPISLIFTLAVMAFIAYMLFTRQPLSRRALSNIWFAVVVMIVIATPYVIASFSTPELAAASRLLYDTDTPRQLTWAETIVRGLNGIFFVGDLTADYNLPGRPMIDVVSGLLLIVGLVTAIRYWRQPRCALLVIAALFLLPVALLARRGANFLAFSALLPVMALLFGLGATTLVRSLPNRARLVAGLLVVGVILFNMGWTTFDLSQRWGQHEQVRATYQARLGELAHHLDVTAADLPSVVCYPSLELTEGAALTDTQLMLLMMHRQSAPLRAANCGISLVLPNGGERMQIVLPEPYMLDRMNPFLREWYANGTVPLRYTAAGEQYPLPPDGVVILNLAVPLADRIGAFSTTAPVSFAPESPGGSAVTASPVRMGGNLTFLGYDSTINQAYLPGDVVPVITYWRVDGVLPPDLRLFVHLLSDPSAIAAQWDGLSVLPSQLQPRDVFIQVAFLQLPFQTLEGQYAVSVGAYTATDDNRLTIYDGAAPRGARLFLGQIEVQRLGN
ncbi:MAG: glycosyltransferase family 39 protein [bacterium]|nr:glycosyltransferase family 39 protein [bacterium]